MSLQNITKENNYDIYCNKIYANDAEIDNITIDNITATNITATNQVSTPSLKTNTLSTILGTGNITSSNNLIVPTITVTNLKTNTLATVSGSGNITSSNNLIAPTIVASTSIITPILNSATGTISITSGLTLQNSNAAPSNTLRYYLQSTGTLTTSGAIVTSLNYRATRIGGLVNVCVQCMADTVLATATSSLTISGIPSDFLPNSTTCNGPILTNTLAGVTLGRYQFNGSGTIVIFATINSGVNFTIGQPCGLFGGTTNFATFSFSRTT